VHTFASGFGCRGDRGAVPLAALTVVKMRVSMNDETFLPKKVQLQFPSCKVCQANSVKVLKSEETAAFLEISTRLLGGGFNYFLIFTPSPREMIQFDDHMFQLGWFNHQLDFLIFLSTNHARATRCNLQPSASHRLRLLLAQRLEFQKGLSPVRNAVFMGALAAEGI